MHSPSALLAPGNRRRVQVNRANVSTSLNGEINARLAPSSMSSRHFRLRVKAEGNGQ
jgi:hypothetical protein